MEGLTGLDLGSRRVCVEGLTGWGLRSRRGCVLCVGAMWSLGGPNERKTPLSERKRGVWRKGRTPSTTTNHTHYVYIRRSKTPFSSKITKGHVLEVVGHDARPPLLLLLLLYVCMRQQWSVNQQQAMPSVCLSVRPSDRSVHSHTRPPQPTTHRSPIQTTIPRSPP